MRATRLAWFTVATVTALVATALPANATGDPFVRMGVWRYSVGSTLSDSTWSARLPITVTWSQYHDEGFCEQVGYFDDSQGHHSEHTDYEAVNGPGSFTTSMPANGSASFDLFTIPCGEGGTSHESASRTSHLVQERAFTRTTGWRMSACDCWSGGAAVRSTRVGATATYTFRGSSMGLVTTTSPTRGKAKIYLDGRFITTVDGYSAQPVQRVIAFQRLWSAPGTHTVKVVSATTARFDIDALVYN